MRLRVGILLSLALASPQTLAGDDYLLTCLNAALAAVSGRTSWDLVTGREYPVIHAIILAQNADIGTRGFRPLDLEKVVSGEHRLLSLGEGNSELVFELLEDRKRRQGASFDPSGILAFDQAYLGGRLKALISPGLWRKLSRYPKNYLGGTYQALDLAKEDGFDEIVSFYSLGFVLHQGAPPEVRAIVDRVVAHLAPGGVLRVLPFTPEHSPGARAAIDRLDELRAMGVIRRYSSRAHYGLVVEKR